MARLFKTRATRHVTLATLLREKTRATELREKIAGVTSVLRSLFAGSNNLSDYSRVQKLYRRATFTAGAVFLRASMRDQD